MATMLDVAKKAGVSKATVSRVLTGNGYVSKQVKERVLKTIEEMEYRPNLLARNLANQKSQSIGLVVTNTLFHGPYFSELLFQAATMTESYGHQLLLADGKHSAEEERQAIQTLSDLRCDAIIIYPRFLTIEEMDDIIEQSHQPIMVINRKLNRNINNCVYSEHQQASFSAVSHLIQQGHKDIAFITGTNDSPTGKSRLAGYKAALEHHRLPIRQTLIIEGKWTSASGVNAIESLLQQNTPFSAIVASNDDMAIGAAKALFNAKISVPQQVSLIGFDDIPMAPFCIPSLSSVQFPVSDMIKEAIKKLLNMLDGYPINQSHSFSGKLIIRDSITSGPYKQVM